MSATALDYYKYVGNAGCSDYPDGLYNSYDSSSCGINFADGNDLLYVFIQKRLAKEQKKVERRFERMLNSFISNGGASVGLVTWRVFHHLCLELIDLPFNDVLVQYSPSNDEIKVDMLFNKGLEISVAKYLNSVVDDNVFFTLRVGGEPYVISTKNLHDLKDVLKKTLSRQNK